MPSWLSAGGSLTFEAQKDGYVFNKLSSKISVAQAMTSELPMAFFRDHSLD